MRGVQQTPIASCSLAPANTLHIAASPTLPLPRPARSVAGALLLVLGAAAATGSWCSFTAPLHCVSPRLDSRVVCMAAARCHRCSQGPALRLCRPPRAALPNRAALCNPRPHICASLPPAVHRRHAGAAAAASPVCVGVCQPPQRAAAAGGPRSNLHAKRHPGVDGRTPRPGGRPHWALAGAASGSGGAGLHLCVLPGAAAAPLVSGAGAWRGAAPAAACWTPRSAVAARWASSAHSLAAHALSCRRDRYWNGEDDGREPLLPQRQRGEPAGPQADSPHAAGYRTPPSRFHSPYTSPGKPPVSYPVSAGPLSAMSGRPAAGSPTPV